MNSCEWTTSINVIANLIAKSSSNEDLELLSAVFCQLGDTLATIATLRDLCGDEE